MENLKTKYDALINACDDEDMLDIIKRDMESLSMYVHAVYMMETSIPIIRARYEGEEVRDRIMTLDKNRTIAHERAIVGTKRLNRFCNMLSVPVMFDGDVEDRYQIADFCKDVVVEIFEKRSGVPTNN